MGKTKISDIYVGLPDAKDAIRSDVQKFIDCYYKPSTFPIKDVASGKIQFIKGNKGVGKTAALRYINSTSSEIKSSFILFEQDYKEKAENAGKRIESQTFLSWNVRRDASVNMENYRLIWRWVIFCTIIVSNNSDDNNPVFYPDDNWERFCNIIKGVIKPDFFVKIGGKIDLNWISKLLSQFPLFDFIIPSLTVEFPIITIGGKKMTFQEAMEEATRAFHNLSRMNCPYYIFVDELEAYCGNDVEYTNDLRMIHDLILEIKDLNLIIKEKWINTMIVCAVRSEILLAIDRRGISKKSIRSVIQGIDWPLSWHLASAAPLEKPFMQLLLKRIEMAEKENREDLETLEERYHKWFPEKIEGLEPSEYIERITWSKPRDIVRLLQCAQYVAGNKDCFSEDVFINLSKEYSNSSLLEIQGELAASYASSEIYAFFDCLHGMRPVFSVDQLEERVRSIHKDILEKHSLNELLKDLYRVGAIGQCCEGKYRWQHYGDDGFMCDTQWRVCIHKGLQKALNNLEDKNTSTNVQPVLEEPVQKKVDLQHILKEKEEKESRKSITDTLPEHTGNKSNSISQWASRSVVREEANTRSINDDNRVEREYTYSNWGGYVGPSMNQFYSENRLDVDEAYGEKTIMFRCPKMIMRKVKLKKRKKNLFLERRGEDRGLSLVL